jgi:hypothetical protein
MNRGDGGSGKERSQSLAGGRPTPPNRTASNCSDKEPSKRSQVNEQSYLYQRHNIYATLFFTQIRKT